MIAEQGMAAIIVESNRFTENVGAERLVESMGIGQDFRNEVKSIANGTHPEVPFKPSRAQASSGFLDGISSFTSNYVVRGFGPNVDPSLSKIRSCIFEATDTANPVKMNEMATAARAELLSYLQRNPDDFDAMALLIATGGFFLPGSKWSDRLFKRSSVNSEAQRATTEMCNGFYEMLDEGYRLGTKNSYNPIVYKNWTNADVTVQQLFALAGILGGINYY